MTYNPNEPQSRLPGTPPQVLPYAGPPGPSGLTPAELYGQVPWFRRNSFNSALLLIALACWIGAPILITLLLKAGIDLPVAQGLAIFASLVAGLALLTVCIVVLTGPVYLPKANPMGQLKIWGVANKVVAGLFLAAWVVLFVLRVLRVLNMK